MALLRQATFEGGALTGASGVDGVNYNPALITEDDALSGDFSVTMPSDSSGDFPRLTMQFDSPYEPDVYTAFYLQIESLPSSTETLFELDDDSLGTVMSVRLTSAGSLRLYSTGSTTVGSASAPLAIGTRYRVEIVRTQAVSGDGILELRLAEGEAASMLVAQSKTITSTAVIRFAHISGIYDDTYTFNIDEWLIDNAAIPTLAALNEVVVTPVDLAAETIIEIDAPFYSAIVDLAATTIIEIETTAAPASANNLSATTIIEVETSADVQQDTNLSATTIIEIDSFERYTGPGTGLLVDDPAERDLTALVNRLREGDHQLVMLSQAGVEGINGVMRVLGRSLNDAGGRQKITPHFVPLPDPTLPLKQRGGKGPSVKPRQSDNIFRQVKDQQRQINRRSRE